MTTRDGDYYGRRTTKAMQEHRAYYGYAYGDKMKSLTSDIPDEIGSQESVYDGLGKLRRVTDPAGATWYRSNTFAFEGIYGEGASEWDIGGLGLALVNQPGQQAGPPLALRFPGDPDPFYIHYFLDNIQSARRLRLDDRTEMGANEYTPYGEFYHTSGLDGLYKFAGHIHDNATAMYWAPYRWYDPQVARWTTRDPAGMVDGPNRYGYVRDNPASMIDVKGDIIWAVVIIFGVAMWVLMDPCTEFGYVNNEYLELSRDLVSMNRTGRYEWVPNCDGNGGKCSFEQETTWDITYQHGLCVGIGWARYGQGVERKTEKDWIGVDVRDEAQCASIASKH